MQYYNYNPLEVQPKDHLSDEMGERRHVGLNVLLLDIY